MSNLPRGIYYEESRDRYRVRIYKYNTVVHCSYHKELAPALSALDSALSTRDHFEKPVKEDGDGSTTDLLARLLNNG